MTVQEIFDSPEIAGIENRMIELEESMRIEDPGRVPAMRALIRVRRDQLARKFVMDEHIKSLLSDFNEALKAQLLRMRRETIRTVDAMVRAGVPGDIWATGKCFLGYDYPKLHPVQTLRAKKVWALLNGTIDGYVEGYEDGVTNGYTRYAAGEEPPSENQVLYLLDEEDNWDDRLRWELTKDMHIVYAVHNLIANMDFSIFDLLWVRDFNMEINAETDYSTYPDDYEFEDVDFS